MSTAHLGVVVISAEYLLAMLDFREGRVVGGEWDSFKRVLRVTVEHPDMPEVGEGCAVEEVMVAVEVEYNTDGHVIEMHRTLPAKKGS